MATGIVRNYNDSKGFGLITPDLGGPALFAHSVEIKGAKKLTARARVEYDVTEGPNGATATNIRLLKN